MPLSDEQWTKLARELGRAAARVDPAWTDVDAHDPGVTMLELLAYSLEALVYRSDRLSADAHALTRGVARRAAALAAAAGASGAGDACGAALQRPRYFAGQLLGADDLSAEQDYVVARLGRLNRLLHGVGIVDGLQVTVEAGSDAPQLVVEPGLAFDRWGREIFVDRCARVALPASGTALLVQLAYREQPCGSVPVPADAPAPGIDDVVTARPTRILETFGATLAAAADEGSVAIARVHRVRGRWRVDPAFEAPRVRR